MHARQILPLLLSAGIALAACSGSKQTRNLANGPVIGVSIQNREAQFYQDFEIGMKNEAAKYGYAVNVVDARRDNAKQQSQVEDFISQQVSAIVLVPYDSQAIGSAIVEANQANIPVFTADIANGSKQGKVVTHVASDNEQGGGEAAKLICKAAHGAAGQVAIIDEPEVTSVQDRVRGFKKTLAARCPKVTIVADIDGGGERAKSSAGMEDILQGHPQLSAVFGINDDAALGALKAIEAANFKQRHVFVVGYDADAEARTAIAQGGLYGDAIQHPELIGAKTIDVIHNYLTHQPVPARVDVPVGAFTKTDATH
jgi:ribose transport system substrate-binding protein